MISQIHLIYALLFPKRALEWQITDKVDVSPLGQLRALEAVKRSDMHPNHKAAISEIIKNVESGAVELLPPQIKTQ